MLQERRQTPRVRAYQPVRLHRVGGDPHVMETLTKDLSVDGFRCLTQQVLPVASEVLIELVVAAGQEPVLAKGRSTWFRSLPQSEQFETGFQFVEMDQKNKRHLSAYLDRISTSSLAISD